MVKITNDLLAALIAATDTCKNTTIFALCHLARSASSMSKIRAEIDQCLINNAIDGETFKISHKDIVPSSFVYLNQVMNESLRLNDFGFL